MFEEHPETRSHTGTPRGCNRNVKENGSRREMPLFSCSELSTYCVPGTALGSGDMVMNTKDNIFALMEKTL